MTASSARDQDAAHRVTAQPGPDSVVHGPADVPAEALTERVCPACGRVQHGYGRDPNHTGCLTGPELELYMRYWQGRRDEFDALAAQAAARGEGRERAGQLRYAAWMCSCRLSDGLRAGGVLPARSGPDQPRVPGA